MKTNISRSTRRVSKLESVICCPECGNRMEVGKDNLAGDYYAQCRNSKCSFDGTYAETLSELPDAIKGMVPLE